jgi:transposase
MNEPAEYATHQKATHRVNPVKWTIDWGNTKSDKDGYTILMIVFHHQKLGARTTQTLSMRFISDNRELEQRLDDLADKHKYEMERFL